MKKIIYLSMALLSIGTFTQCTKPTKDFSFSINPKPFDYTVAVKFYDAATPGVPPSNITLTLSGDASSSVYEISGVKTFNVVEGIISMGILPAVNPTVGHPTKFLITATCPGYLPAQIPVTITAGQPTELINVSMINLTKPPAGVNVDQKHTALVGNTTPAATNLSTPAAAANDQVVAIDIPAGTGFNDASGAPISGSTLNSTVVSFGTNSAASLNAFPGGNVSDNIIDASGATVTGMFQTAGFASITMDVSGTTVKTFTQPITLHMGLNPNQVNPSTGNAFHAGDSFAVWSYQTETMQWKYEKNAVIVNNGTALEAVFQTSHLTYYNLAILNNTCSSASITFNTGLDHAETFLMDIFTANDPNIPVIAGYMVQVADGGVVNFTNLPQGNLNVKLYRNTANNSQTNFMVRDGNPVGTYTGALCGGNTGINITIPAAVQNIYFNIQGQCPSNSANPVVRPTVDVWYRLANASGEYQLLGQVQQGYLTTSNLTYQSSYDFKVIYGGTHVYLKTKTVDSTYYQRTVEVPADQIAVFCN